MGRFINPFSDWGFKKIFGQTLTKDILITFLNSLLEGEHVITDLTFLDKEQLPETKDNRGTIYDMYCKTDEGKHILVEMQNRDHVNFVDRTLYYMAKAIVGQGKHGYWLYEFNAVYGVFFMNFKTSELEGKLRTDVVLADKDTHEVVNDKMRMIYLQMPYFTKSEDECETLFDCFIYTLKNMEIFDRMPFMARNAVFKRLAEIADVNTLTKEEHEKYDASIKVMRDNLATYEAAVRDGMHKGMQQGIQQGMQQGLQQGIQQGLQQGETNGILKTARNLKNMGLPLEQICKATGLTEIQVKELN